MYQVLFFATTSQLHKKPLSYWGPLCYKGLFLLEDRLDFFSEEEWMPAIFGLLLLFLCLGLFAHKYDGKTHLLMAIMIIGMLLILYLT